MVKMLSFLKECGLLEIQHPFPPSREYQFLIDSNEIKDFVEQYNELTSKHSQLKILREICFKTFDTRTALDGSDLYYKTVIIKRLKK